MKNAILLRNLFVLLTALKVLIILFIPEYRVWEPEEMALNLLNGKGFYVDFLGQHNYNYQFPLYPFCIYLIYSVFGPIQQVVVIFNCLVYSLAIWILGKLMYLIWPHFEKHAYWIFCLLVLVYPATNVYVLGNIHPFALDLLLCISGFYFSLRWAKEQNTKQLIFTFLTVAFILVDRITLIVAPAIGLLWGLFLSKPPAKQLVRLSIIGSLALLPIAGWMISTYQHNQKIALMSSTGVNLWIGIQKVTEGTAQKSNGDSYLSLLSSGELKRLEALSPMEQDDFFRKKYSQEKAENPTVFYEMFAIKMRNFWWFRSDLGVDYSPKIQKWVFIYKLGYALLFSTMLLGFLKFPMKFWCIALLLLGISIFQAWFYVETRHRVLLEPFMLLVAFSSIYEMYRTSKLVRQTIS